MHLLVDTSTWFDLSKRRDGQRWIVAIRALAHEGVVDLLVPSVVIEEFERKRPRVEASMTASVAQRFRLIKEDLDDYGGSDDEHALRVIEGAGPPDPAYRGHDHPELRRGPGVVARGLAPSSPATRSDIV